MQSNWIARLLTEYDADFMHKLVVHNSFGGGI